MGDRQIRRRQLVLAGILAVALLLAWGTALQEIRKGRVERAIDRFRAAPNGAHA
jgi:hypothetical protein